RTLGQGGRGAVLLAKRRGVPAAAERLDELDAGDQPALADAEQRLRVPERHGLRGHHRGVSDRAGAVLIEGELYRQVRRLDRLILHIVLLLEDAQRGEVILDLLEGDEHGLAVAGHGRVVRGARPAYLRPARAEVDERVARGRTQ